MKEQTAHVRPNILRELNASCSVWYVFHTESTYKWTSNHHVYSHIIYNSCCFGFFFWGGVTSPCGQANVRKTQLCDPHFHLCCVMLDKESGVGPVVIQVKRTDHSDLVEHCTLVDM